MEKRFCHRVNVKGGTCIICKKGFLREASGTIENISLSGVYIMSDIQVKVKDKMRMIIHLSDSLEKIKIDAKVTRVEDRGIAFKYGRIDHKDFWTLQTFLRPKDVFYN